MNQEDAAEGFRAIGSEARLEVLGALVRAGRGLTVGEIGERTQIAPSTLAHHLKSLAAAGLVRQEKAGRSIVCTADFERLQALAAFILEDCCAEAERRRLAHNG